MSEYLNFGIQSGRINGVLAIWPNTICCKYVSQQLKCVPNFSNIGLNDAELIGCDNFWPKGVCCTPKFSVNWDLKQNVPFLGKIHFLGIFARAWDASYSITRKVFV